MKTIRIFLLVLIIIGIGLLITQRVWVPKLVDRILKSENVFQASQNSFPGTAAAEWKTYDNEKFGFSFKYPADWAMGTEHVAENDIEGGTKLVVSFRDLSTLSEINIRFNSAPGGKNFYVSNTEPEYISYLGKPKNIIVNGYDGVELAYIEENSSLSIVEYSFLDRREGFLSFQLITPIKHKEGTKKTFDQILSTLEFNTF